MFDLVGENRVGKRYKFKSPIRSDRHGDCYLYQQGDRLLMIDFAHPDKVQWDVISICMVRFNLRYSDALSYLYNKYKNNIPVPQPVLNIKDHNKAVREYTKIQISSREWQVKDYVYWKQYGLDPDYIQEFNNKRKIKFFPISEAFVGESILSYTLPTYAWVFNSGGIKIYSPESKVNKWKSNTTKSDLFFENDFEYENLIITSSYKDALVLSKSLKCSFRAFNSERVVSSIPEIEKFNKKLLSFDNDPTGIEFQLKASKELDIPFFNYQGKEKDWADAYKNNKSEYEKNIEMLKNSYYFY